jgi:O-antigen/teichoic acid export membrane protein
MQIGFGLCKLGALGLILGSVLADVLASLNLLRAAFPDLRALPTLFRWERLLQLAREYRDFPVYSASVRVINSLSLGLPVLLLAHYYGIATAGAYAFALRILQTPANLVLGALHQVLFQKACEIHQQGRTLKTLYLQTTLGLFALAALPFLLLLVWATPLFTWLFGTAWALAGELARWIALWVLFAFCNLPATLFARILRVQRKLFLFNILLLAARTLTLVLGGLYLSASQTVCLFSAVGAIMNICLILIIGAVVLRSPGVEPDSRRPDVSPMDSV